MIESMPVSPSSRNLEVKVRCHAPDLARFAEQIQTFSSMPPARLQQVDTYFAVPQGRLKIRETTSENEPPSAELIAYQRPDDAGPRWSMYTRVPLDPASVPALITAFTETVGMLTRVEKQRTVGWSGGTRIHLDDVAWLGCFVELETVATGRSAEDVEAEYAAVAARLGLDAFAPVAGSYSDLMISARGKDRQQHVEGAM